MSYNKKKYICENPHHPFKQDWYEFDGEIRAGSASTKYCSSCMFYFNTIKTIFRAVLLTNMPTLYGKSEIHSDKEQLKKLLDEVYDEVYGELQK